MGEKAFYDSFALSLYLLEKSKITLVFFNSE
jgi:hypothetical protein